MTIKMIVHNYANSYLNGFQDLKEQKNDPTFIKGVLKVVSYATIIFPVIALVAYMLTKPKMAETQYEATGPKSESIDLGSESVDLEWRAKMYQELQNLMQAFSVFADTSMKRTFTAIPATERNAGNIFSLGNGLE